MFRLLFLISVLGSVLRAQTLVKGPYLQIGTSSGMTVRWQTNIPTDTKLSYGTSTVLSSFSGNLVSDTLHEVKLTGLLPYTKYFYSVGTTTSVIQGDTNNYFVTSPPPGQEGNYRFWVTGDCGTPGAIQLNCKNQYNLYNNNKITNGWLLLGDNAYFNGYNRNYDTAFFAPYQTDIMKHAVLWPVPGNHDYDNGAANSPAVAYFSIFSLPAAAEAGGFPSGTEQYYSYDYGNIHFIALDSYGSSGGKKMNDTLGNQVLWLKQDLAANTKKWTIAYWHHPPYTMGTHNSDTELDLDSVRTNFIRILERNNVDLILCGHSHDYERSKLLRGHYGAEPTFNKFLHQLDTSTALYNNSVNSCPYIKDTINKNAGTVYVVAGSSSKLGSPQASYPHDAMYYSNMIDGGSLIVDVDANRLDVTFLCADGVVRDNFTMFKNVNKVSSFTITPTQTITAAASWPGNYLWSNGDTTRTAALSPTTNTVFWVKDKFSCVADTFKVFVSPAGINEFSFSKNKTFTLYPNPTKDNLVLKLFLQKESEVGFRVYSSSGTLIKEYESSSFLAGENNVSVWMTDLKLQNGLYFIEANIDGARVTDKFILYK